MSQQSSYWSRIWPKRVFGLKSPTAPAYLSTNITPGMGWQDQAILGDNSQAFLEWGTGTANAALIVTAGQFLPGAPGREMTLTVTTGSGALAVTSNGLDIAVVMASGGSTASAIITALNAQFPTGFAQAALAPGSSGAGKPGNLSKTYFKTPAFPSPARV